MEGGAGLTLALAQGAQCSPAPVGTDVSHGGHGIRICILQLKAAQNRGLSLNSLPMDQTECIWVLILLWGSS